MYQVIDGPEACRMFPATNLRTVFKSKLVKVHKTLQTPAAFRAWLVSHRPSSSSSNECVPMKTFVRTLVARQMEVRACLDGTITVSDWKHGASQKPTAEMNLPPWVWRFMMAYYEAWGEYWATHCNNTEYIVDGVMPIESLLELLDKK